MRSRGRCSGDEQGRFRQLQHRRASDSLNSVVLNGALRLLRALKSVRKLRSPQKSGLLAVGTAASSPFEK